MTVEAMEVQRAGPYTAATDAGIRPDAVEIGGEAGLKYVYSGNVPGDHGENTYCFNCKNLLIERFGFKIMKTDLKGSKCANCGTVLDGIF